MGFAFQHLLIIISIFPKRNTGATFISSLHVLPETPLRYLSPLATLLGAAHFICQQNPPWPVTLMSSRLLIIQIICHYQVDMKSRQMLIKGYIKKKANHCRWTNSTRFSTFLPPFVPMQNDEVVFHMHNSLNYFLRLSLKISNTEKHPCDSEVSEVGKHYKWLWLKKF